MRVHDNFRYVAFTLHKLTVFFNGLRFHLMLMFLYKIIFFIFFFILYTLLHGKFVFVTQCNCVASEQRH